MGDDALVREKRLSGAVIFLDIDRTTSPVDDLSAWDDYTEAESKMLFPVKISPRAMKQLAKLPARIVIASTWPGGVSVPTMIRFLGRPLTALRISEREGPVRKPDAILAWLKRHPGVRRIVWADDLLAQEDLDDTRDALERYLKAHDIATLYVRPLDGLTPADIGTIEAFVRREPKGFSITWGPNHYLDEFIVLDKTKELEDALSEARVAMSILTGIPVDRVSTDDLVQDAIMIFRELIEAATPEARELLRSPGGRRWLMELVQRGIDTERREDGEEA